MPLPEGDHCCLKLESCGSDTRTSYTVAIGRGQGTDPIYNPNFWPCFWKEAQEDQTVKCLKNSFYSNLISIHTRENGSIWARAFSYFRNLSSFSKALTWIPLSLSFYCYYYFFLTPRCWYNLFISCHHQQLVTKKKTMISLKTSGSIHRTCLTLADFFTFLGGTLTNRYVFSSGHSSLLSILLWHNLSFILTQEFGSFDSELIIGLHMLVSTFRVYVPKS